MEPGQVLAGRYQVDGMIASGGFAVVYHGTLIDEELPVAIKAQPLPHCRPISMP